MRFIKKILVIISHLLYAQESILIEIIKGISFIFEIKSIYTHINRNNLDIKYVKIYITIITETKNSLPLQL